MLSKKVIGAKMNRKSVIINIMILFSHTIFWSFLGVYWCVGNVLGLTQIEKLVSMVIVTSILLLIQIPMIGATQRIEFSDKVIEFYYVKGYIHQFKEVLHILYKNVEQPAIQIVVDEIDKVNLSYRKTYAGYGLIGYMIVLTFLMKDGTMITLSPENMSKTEDGIYLSLINILLDKDIMVIDKLNLKDGLISDSNYFQKYVEEMERKKES